MRVQKKKNGIEENTDDKGNFKKYKRQRETTTKKVEKKEKNKKKLINYKGRKEGKKKWKKQWKKKVFTLYRDFQRTKAL